MLADPEVGQIYTGTVVKIVEFGAFVSIDGGKEGLVHVSEIMEERVEKVSVLPCCKEKKSMLKSLVLMTEVRVKTQHQSSKFT